MEPIERLKGHVIAEIDARRDELIRTSDTIHANPELGFREFQAVELLSGMLAQSGFSVERGVAGMETAFIATAQGRDEGPIVAFLGEYDALAGLGHACGHNIIGTAAVGAGLAMQAALPELAGTVQVIGTPAEEGGGGKVLMVEAGVFEAVEVELATGEERMGSSDIGNVSQVVPTIHPYIAIASEEVGGHTAEFREAAASPAGHAGLLNAAKALAMTAVDLLAEPANLAEAKRRFEEQKVHQAR